jgi:hypothetical protein
MSVNDFESYLTADAHRMLTYLNEHFLSHDAKVWSAGAERAAAREAFKMLRMVGQDIQTALVEIEEGDPDMASDTLLNAQENIEATFQSFVREFYDRTRIKP